MMAARPSRSLALGVVVAVMAAVAGAAAWWLLATGEMRTGGALAPASPVVAIGERRPDFALPDLEGRSHHVSEWDGRVLIINFWATWCPPCRREMPAFARLQRRYGEAGLQFVGIALDAPEPVRELISELDIGYPILIGQEEVVALSRRLGNGLGGLPYTVVIARDGRIVQRITGEWAEPDAALRIRELLAQGG